MRNADRDLKIVLVMILAVALPAVVALNTIRSPHVDMRGEAAIRGHSGWEKNLAGGNTRPANFRSAGFYPLVPGLTIRF